MPDDATTDIPVVELYTDGACSGNPGPGGWAFILRHLSSGKEMEESGAERETTTFFSEDFFSSSEGFGLGGSYWGNVSCGLTTPGNGGSAWSLGAACAIGAT